MNYPLGARFLLWTSLTFGIGVQQLYSARAFRWVMMVLDRFDGSPPS